MSTTPFGKRMRVNHPILEPTQTTGFKRAMHGKEKSQTCPKVARFVNATFKSAPAMNP